MPLVRVYGGMKIKLEAINPTTGAPVGGVTVSQVAIYGRNISDDADEDVPLYDSFLTPLDV